MSVNIDATMQHKEFLAYIYSIKPEAMEIKNGLRWDKTEEGNRESIIASDKQLTLGSFSRIYIPSKDIEVATFDEATGLTFSYVDL